jgi:hypothetical protein
MGLYSLEGLNEPASPSIPRSWDILWPFSIGQFSNKYWPILGSDWLAAQDEKDTLANLYAIVGVHVQN